MSRNTAKELAKIGEDILHSEENHSASAINRVISFPYVAGEKTTKWLDSVKLFIKKECHDYPVLSYEILTIAEAESQSATEYQKIIYKLEAIYNDLEYWGIENDNSTEKVKKERKLFISHSSKDKNFVKIVIEFLESMQLSNKEIVCTSVDGYKIPLNVNGINYLKNQFTQYDIHVLYLLSENYYNSVYCLNEMGAAWVTGTDYSFIALPGFSFQGIESGVIDKNRQGVFCDDDDYKQNMLEFKEFLIEYFNLEEISSIQWEKSRDYFIQNIRKEFDKR